MSLQITEAFVKQFSANVFHLSQQKGSRLRGAVRQESQQGKSAFYDRIGASTAIKRTTRHGDTPRIDVPHSRRRVTLVDYEWADLIDDSDKIRLLMDPESEYALSAMWALGRAQDDEIIEKALDDAFGGEEGSTTVAHPNSQKLVASDGVTAGGVNLNVLTLRRAKQKLDEADVDPSIRRYIACTASQINSLLGETEVTSSDFNTIRALVRGEVDQFMGFEFIRIERMLRPTANITFDLTDGSVGAGAGTLVAATARNCFAWAEDGLLLSVGQDMRARISERDDKSYSTQVFASMGVGSTRMEEEKVVQISVSEA